VDVLTEEFDTGNIGRMTFDRPTPAFTDPQFRHNDKTDAIRLDTTTERKRWWWLLDCEDVC
jgi:hypothetical protein